MKKLIYILIVFVITSCDSQDDYVKSVYVNETIILTNDNYTDLQPNGSSIFIDGGNAGIIVYHFATNEYKAYDRNCTYNPSDPCSYIDSVNSGIAYCGCCTSVFLLSQDGLAINKPAFISLTQYQCYLNGQELHISNY